MRSWERAMHNARFVSKLTGRRARVRGIWLYDGQTGAGSWFYYAVTIDRTAP